MALAARFWLPEPRLFVRLARMGAKYLPTIKDLKASQRFKQKQSPLHKFKKSPGEGAAKKGKKK
jgi:hypothetical protein